MSSADKKHLAIQQEELTVLESIYLQDLHIIKSSAPFKFEIVCRPFLSSQDDISPEQYNLKVVVEFVKNYPDTSPKIDFETITNITQDNIADIELITKNIIDKQNGIPIIFDIVETARDWIHTNIIDMALKTEQKDKKEVFAKKQYATFTQVTTESFALWEKLFKEEMLIANKNLILQQQELEQKLTGKQYFLSIKEKGEEEEGKEGEETLGKLEKTGEQANIQDNEDEEGNEEYGDDDEEDYDEDDDDEDEDYDPNQDKQ